MGQIKTQRVLERHRLLGRRHDSETRRQPRIRCGKARIDAHRQRNPVLRRDAAQRLAVVAYRAIRFIRREDLVLLVRLDDLGALLHALNQHPDAFLVKRLRARRADTPAAHAAQGEVKAVADLIILQLAAAHAHGEGFAACHTDFRRRNARRLCGGKNAIRKYADIHLFIFLIHAAPLTFRRRSDG